MKFKSILAILLLFCFLLPSCASSLTDLPEETAATAESKGEEETEATEEQEENGNEGKEEQKNEEKKTDEKKKRRKMLLQHSQLFLSVFLSYHPLLQPYHKKEVFCIPSMQNFSTI